MFFLIVVEVMSSLLLIVAILLQRSKGEGLGMAFGAEMGEALFGTRAGNILVKATIWLGRIFLVNTTILAKIYTRSQYQSLMREHAPANVQREAPPLRPGADVEDAVP